MRSCSASDEIVLGGRQQNSPFRSWGGRGAGTSGHPFGEDTASPEQDGGTLSAAWHFDQEEEFEGITTDTTLPLL